MHTSHELLVMPELPEVEAYKKYLESTSLHLKIKTAEAKSDTMLVGVAFEELEQVLVGKEFQGCRRHGKYLFAKLQSGLWLVLHFGMTGDLKYFKTQDGEPRFTRLLILFENGKGLAFVDQRKLGEIAVTPSPEEFVRQRNLGLDALEIDFPSFKAMAAKSHGAVKGTLLDQHRMAGIGNLYADEILYQSRLHPQTKTCAFDEETLRRLFKNMKRILQTAIKHNADSTNFPKRWLFNNRIQGGKCPNCSGKISTAKVAGRTAYFCPSCQKAT